MHDVAGWVQRLNDIRAELVGQFGTGRAASVSIARIDHLAADMASAGPDPSIPQPPPDFPLRSIEVFNLILSLYRRTGIVPTIPEMCRAAGINTRFGVERQLGIFEAAGLIRREPKPDRRHARRPPRAIQFLRNTPIPVTS